MSTRTGVGNGYKALLRDAKARLSHSRRGECYDNAQSHWSRLKAELLDAREWPVLRTWPTRKRAWPTILTTTITNAVTPALVIQNLIYFINSNLLLLPNSLQFN